MYFCIPNRHSTWGMGNKRSFNEYMKMVGIDTLTKKVTVNTWCHRGGNLSRPL